MERLKRHVCHSRGRWNEVREKAKEKEKEEMSLCLYDCLRAVGLQHHYASFTSVGVDRSAHLSALTMEDYPMLGIRSMEDRTRLFHLVQMVKTLDLEYEDCDADESHTAADSSFTYDGCGDPDEDVYDDEDESEVNATIFSKPSGVRRRLDFSGETVEHHLFRPEGPVHVHRSHDRNNVPSQSKASATPVQLDTRNATARGCKGKKNNNHSLDVNSHKSDYHREANTLSNIKEANAMNSSPSRSSSAFFSFHKLKPRPATVASKRFSNKPAGQKYEKGISKKEKLYPEMSSKEATEHTTKPTPVYESKRTAGYNYGLPLSCPAAANKKQPGAQRISVCVRKRPLTRTECRRGEADVVTTPSGECVIVHESKEAVDLTQYILQHRFYFDQVFGEESSNEEVYQRTAYPLVQHMLNGGNATCFAYGQTGAGKTHTMLGSPPVRPGLYALAVRDIFALLSTSHRHSPLLVYVSFFEIYCGQLYDLLDHRKRLFAREDGQKVVHIVGLRDVRVDSVSSLLEVISQGTEERTQGISGVNPLSSRSHALLQIQLRDPHQQIAGRMWFVDLAGSERASDTKEPDRQSRMEGAEINQSLLALKECIRSLDQEQSHTPFRQSKLTQVLKDSFVGDSMTCMIANISPDHLATEHTLNTLRYADRVKELRGQREKGGRRGKIPSPKRNLSNNSGGNTVGTRGKSPPKKPKLGRQREDFAPTTPPKIIATGGTILCSTPKNSRWGEETSASTRKGIGLEHITPVRGLLEMNDKRERAGRRRERYGVTESGGRSDSDGNVVAGLVLGQATGEHLKESEFYHKHNENQQSTLRGGGQEERRQIEQRRQVERSGDTCNKVERLCTSDSQQVDEREKERRRHLRQYHQQLQQFIPSPASSSVHPTLSSSLSSSASPSSSSSLQPSSRLSVSVHLCHGLEDVLDTYGARVEVKANGNRGQSSFFPSGGRRDEAGHGDAGGAGCRVSRERIEARFGQDGGKNEKRRSLKATREEEVRVGSAGMDGGGERRWAWAADGVTGAMPADVEALVSYNCAVGEEGVDASDVPAFWSTVEPEGVDGSSLLSTHSSSLFDQPPVESSHQRSPAERPLSPACEHTKPLLTPIKLSDLSLDLKHTNISSLPLQNAQQGAPLSSLAEKFDAKRREISSAQSATLPPPNTQNGCKTSAEPLNTLSKSQFFTQVRSRPDFNAKMSALPHEEAADSSSYIMDPLSISLLQVDQQVATASFLQGEQNTSLCPPETKSRGDNGRKVIEEHLTFAELDGKAEEDEDVEFRLSFTSDTTPAPHHTEGRKGLCCTTYEHCGIGMMKPPFPEVMLLSLQENNHQPKTTPATEVLGNKTPASPPKPLICASMKTPVTQSSSSSVQQPGTTGSLNSHNLTKKGASQLLPEYAHNTYNKDAFSISPQSESALGQFNTVDPDRSSNSLQPNCCTESNIEEKKQIRPIIHLSTLEDLDHGQWRVVQAHWEQLEEMEALWHKEGTLLCQQPDMAFGEYVHKLEDILERKARCVHSMIAQLQPYLKLRQSNQPHSQEEHNHHPNT